MTIGRHEREMKVIEEKIDAVLSEKDSVWYATRQRIFRNIHFQG